MFTANVNDSFHYDVNRTKCNENEITGVLMCLKALSILGLLSKLKIRIFPVLFSNLVIKIRSFSTITYSHHSPKEYNN